MPVFNKLIYNGTEYVLGGGGNIGEPLNLSVTSSGTDAIIKWEDNEIGTIPPTSFVKSELIRKVGSAPSSPSDGTLVVTETTKDTYKTNGYVDQGLTDGTTYYYRVFSYSDLGGISYCDAVSVTPSPWQPGVNTIAYFPLDSDLLDHSGNSFSVTTYGNVSIGTAGGVSAGDFSSIGELGGSVATTGSLTVLGYAYKTANPNNDNASMFGFAGGGSMGAPLCQVLYWNTNGPANISNKPGVALFDWDTQANQTAVSMNNNEWVHFAATFDWSTKVVKLYTNGVLSSQYTTSATSHPDYLGMSRANGIDRSWIGYLSEVIFESKCWTATEIADYVDATKANYGIS